MSGNGALTDPKPNLPDFCSSPAVLAVILIAELVAIVLTLAGHGPKPGFLLALSTSSMFMLWLGLSSAVVLCKCRAWLTSFGRARGLVVGFVMLQLLCLIISECSWWLNESLASRLLTDLGHREFLFRNLMISMIVSAMSLRYFYVTGEWRRNVELESRAQIKALQARIRPHFLFNSMNTIASLTRSDPARAEEAIEDLADLFRATLGEAQHRIPLKEELEVARIYQRMEQLRLGDRLAVHWDVAELPMRVLIPGLSVQPLLENAIYHGIEPLPEGGEIHVRGARLDDGRIELVIENPVLPSDSSRSTSQHKGHQLALDNIKRRFELAYAEQGVVTADAIDDRFVVRLVFPDLPG